jgi:polyisoprenoid-binding protein YceI
MIAALMLSATLAIDTAKSSVQFTVEHIFVEHVNGTLPISNGNVVVSDGSSIPVSVSATLDATRIRTGDSDRDGVLQTPDWFDTKDYPTWKFVSTKIEPQGPSAFGMDGLLTIRGVTHPEHLNVTVAGDRAHPVYQASGSIDRKVWGMAVTRLDPVIGNPVGVTLEIQTK